MTTLCKSLKRTCTALFLILVFSALPLLVMGQSPNYGGELNIAIKNNIQLNIKIEANETV